MGDEKILAYGQPARLRGWAWWRPAMLGLYPLVMLAALYGTWLAGWASLGHVPQPSLDDPKSIGRWVDPPYIVFGLLMFGAMPAAVVLAVVAVVMLARKGARVLPPLAAAAAAWVAAYVVLAADPGGVLYWYMD
jgi:hypothetical protein